jgi:rhodanese-related sulfurtransferase
MMARGKNERSIYWYWGLAALVISLALVWWAWPGHLASPRTTPESGSLVSAVVDQYLDVNQAYQKRQEGAFMLDVRTSEEWAAGHIPGAVLIPLDQLSTRSGELPGDQEIVIYCRSGNRSAQALTLLSGAGLANIYSMDGGLNSWIVGGYEVVTGE